MKNRKILFYIVLLLLGVVLVYIGAYVINSEDLKTVSGVCIGIGSGLFGLSISQIVPLLLIAKNAEYSRKITIDEKDERNIAIRNRAKSKGFDAMGIILGITMLIFVLMNVDLIVICLIVSAYLLIYAVQIYYLVKYSKEM